MIRDFIVNVLMFCVNRDVVAFNNGSAAWSHLENPDSADIVLSDVEMPVMNGFELLTRIKQKDPNKKCILMSGVHDNETTAKQLGADAFLAKPFGMNALFKIVDTFVVENN